MQQGGPKKMEPPRDKKLEELARKREKKKTFRPGFSFLSVLRMRASRRRFFVCFASSSSSSFCRLVGARNRVLGIKERKEEEEEASVAKTRGGGGRDAKKKEGLFFYTPLCYTKDDKKETTDFPSSSFSPFSVSPEPLKSITS